MITTAGPDAEFLKGLCVLYVEDDEEVRLQLLPFLSRRVRRVIAACDGAEGLAAFRAERPDVVVTDVRMPVMDGLAMARELRREAPGLPIIVTTAFNETDHMERAREVGVEHYVTKPVERAEMHRTLLSCARRLRLGGEPEGG